jgi:outer membrane protein assembly factor BamB
MPLILACSLPGSTGMARAADWPQFRGPGASGVANGKAAPFEWDVESGKNVKWKTPIPGLGHSAPVVWGDRLYACRDNGMLTCFEAKTGKELYRERLEGLGFTASPVASGDHLYFTSEDGQVLVVQAGPTFKLLATDALGANFLATPGIADGVIFFRTQEYLVAVGG